LNNQNSRSEPIRLDCHYSGRGPHYVECSILSNDVEIFDEKMLHKDHEKHKTTIETDNWQFDVTDYVNRSGKVAWKKRRLDVESVSEVLE
jgi:hypothetical protein